MKRYGNNNNFTSYAVAATLGAVVGSVGTIWLQHHSKTNQEISFDDSQDTDEGTQHPFTTDFTAEDTVSGTYDKISPEDNLFMEENAAIDPTFDYEDPLPIEKEYED